MMGLLITTIVLPLVVIVAVVLGALFIKSVKP